MAWRGGTASFERALPAGPVAVGEARRLVRDQLAESLPGDAVAEIELLTSELVSNAIRHARIGDGTIGLNIAVGPRTIRVSVVDGGAGFEPTNLVRSSGDEEGGWGLFLVEEMSDRWGSRKDPHLVWFEIDR